MSGRGIAPALVLSLAVALSGCATGPGSMLHTWREGSTADRALIVTVAVCFAVVGVILYRNSNDGGRAGGDVDHGEACLGVCTPPPVEPGRCFLGRDQNTGLPCW